MKRPKRPPREEVQRREEVAWALRVAGRTEAAIAQELGITQGAVSKILDRVSKAALRRLTREVELYKVVQLEQLEHIVSEAMRAWEVSKEDSVTVQGFSDGKFIVTTKTQCGNPAFLGQVRGALADIRDLLGLNTTATAQAPAEPVKIVVEYRDALKKVYGEEPAPLGLVGT
jgi:predicted transcriptional regulator